MMKREKNTSFHQKRALKYHQGTKKIRQEYYAEVSLNYIFSY